MISLHNILSIAKYERKTLLRSWFFRIFSGLSLLVLFGMNFGMVIEGGGGQGWTIRAISSAIPYFNLLILNVAQAIIAVFLASDFLKRDKKLDTTEVIYMRSMTNSEYVIGKTWGNLQVFLVLNILVVILALVFNLLADGTSVDWVAYAAYLVLISVPTLLFIMGLSFLLMSVIRNQAITFVLILGYIGITLFLLQAKYYYIFDYMAFNIPMLKSGIIGFGNFDTILNHRAIYFCLGFGFIFMSIFLLKRLPQSEGMVIFSLVFSLIFIAAGGYFAYSHLSKFTKTKNIRAEAVGLNNKYVKKNFPDVTSIGLSVDHKGQQIAVNSTLNIVNNSEKEIDKLIFSLNNGLKISSFKVNGSEKQFLREHHLAFVNDGVKLAPGDSAQIDINYQGTIDEAFCYLDIDEKSFQEKYGTFVINIDKRYAFVMPEYVLLTPESNWYPKPGVTFSSEDVSWNRTQFIDFSLEVKTDPGLTAISQGEAKEISEGNFKFGNHNALTQLSLAIGNYQHKSFTENNIEFGVWYLEGNDFFSEFFEEINDTIPRIISERFGDFERTYNLQYSSKHLSLVEVPAQFKTYERIWTSGQEMVQPEQVFIPEKACMINDADLKNSVKRMERMGRRGMDMGYSPEEIKLMVLTNFLGNFTREEGRANFRMSGGSMSVTETTSPYFIFPLLYKFQNNISSAKWPVTNRVFEAYLKSQSEDMHSMFMRNMTGISEDELANIALQDSSFAEIISNPKEKQIIDNVIKLKGDVLFSIIQWRVGEDKFMDYLTDLLNNNKFRNIRFKDFDNDISEKFGVELTPIMEDWFLKKKLPGFIFSPIEAVKVKSDDMILTKITFSVTNFTETEGVIKVTFRLGGFGGRGFGFMMGGGGEDNTLDEIIYLEANQTKEVNYLLNSDPRMISINTMTSQNIPQVLTDGFRDIEEDLKVQPFEGERILSEPVKVALANEIIVDNEDPEFRVTTHDDKSLLQKWLLNSEESTRKYSGYNNWHPPTNWTLTTNSDFFGKYIRSGYYIKSGDGSLKAQWNVPLTEAGYYDVYYYLYKNRSFRRGGPGGGGPPGGGGGPGEGNRGSSGDYNFIIYHDEGAEDVSLEFSSADEGWNHLGSYYFSPDTALIELTNKSGLNTINADAVKLVKL